MKLIDIIDNLESFDVNLTIYAKKTPNWEQTSYAVVTQDPESGILPEEAKGLYYLMEIYLAKEILNVWSEWRNGRKPNIQEKLEAIIYYSTHDAYMPVE